MLRNVLIRYLYLVFVGLLGISHICYALPDSLKPGGGFETAADHIITRITQREAKLYSTDSCEPGLYVFKAEYRTEHFDSTGCFAVDAKTPDYKTSLSTYQWQTPVGDWAPLILYIQVEQPTRLMVRFGNWKGTQSDGALLIRNASVEPCNLSDMAEKNWLGDGSLDAGHMGFIPTDWYAKDPVGDLKQQTLIANPSYRIGKHIWQIKGNGEKTSSFYGHSYPLPDNGIMELSVWARSDDGAKINLHIVRDGWGKRSEVTHAPNETWKKYTITWPVSKEDRKWFFTRVDKDMSTSTVQLADMQLTWHAAQTTSQDNINVDPYAFAKSQGWQGTPGVNLLYNPDLELGGTGFFYDYSWPKQYQHYFRTIAAQPIEFLENQGVDGGTCALLRNIALRGYCFPVTVGKTYTVSADLKAAPGATNPQCSALALDPEWHAVLWTKADKIPADQWKRYSWTFKWDKPNIQQRGYVNFGGSDVLIDRIQIVEGTQTSYQAPPVMVGLMYERWPYFMQGRDTAKASIKVVPGIKRDGTTAVQVVAKDAWGAVVWQKQFDASLNTNTVLPIDLPMDQLGTFHVEMNAQIDGKTAGIGISRYAVIASPVVLQRKPGEYGLAGICQETFNFPAWLCEDHAVIQSDLGITLNRFFASVPPDLPMPIPAEFKEILLAKSRPFSKAGIDLMPCIGLIPRSGAHNNAGTLDMPTAEELALYGEYLAAYVQALEPEIKHFEIFNEPNLWRVRQGPDQGKPAMYPEKYFEYQKLAYQTIKRINPNLTVACNAMNNVNWTWIDAWMKLGAGNYMDVFTYHPYGQTNFYETGVKLRKVMADFGFNGQLVNSEKYYGANIFYDRAGYEETRRGYYLPHFGELATAGRSIQHFVTQAAVGMPVCFFDPTQTISRRGPANELFVYDFFTAYSTAARLMATAGVGEEINLGPSINAIVFVDAKDGPLVVLWSPALDIQARMMLKGDLTVMDIMGNPYTQEQLAKGARIASDPVYVRFAKNTSKQDIVSLLSSSQVIGLGDPFKLDIAITGSRQISVHVTSQRNQPMDGRARLLNLPADWKLSQTEQRFTQLLPGQTIRLDYQLDQVTFQNMASYAVSAIAEQGEEFTRTDASLRPIFAQKQESILVDGNLDDWQNATWIELGDQNISKEFSQTLKRMGNDDLSAKVAMGWRDNAFSLAIVVRDDVHHAADAARMGWQGDSVQIYFDPRNDATVSRENRDDDVTYIISRISEQSLAWLDKGAEGNYKGAANQTDEMIDGDVQVAIVRKDHQTIYEMVFPQQSCLPDALLKADGNIGFSLLINDNDGKGRKTGLTLSPKGSEPYKGPHEYRDLIFE